MSVQTDLVEAGLREKVQQCVLNKDTTWRDTLAVVRKVDAKTRAWPHERRDAFWSDSVLRSVSERVYPNGEPTDYGAVQLGAFPAEVASAYCAMFPIVFYVAAVIRGRGKLPYYAVRPIVYKRVMDAFNPDDNTSAEDTYYVAADEFDDVSVLQALLLMAREFNVKCSSSLGLLLCELSPKEYDDIADYGDEDEHAEITVGLIWAFVHTNGDGRANLAEKLSCFVQDASRSRRDMSEAVCDANYWRAIRQSLDDGDLFADMLFLNSMYHVKWDMESDDDEIARRSRYVFRHSEEFVHAALALRTAAGKDGGLKHTYKVVRSQLPLWFYR